MSLFAGSREVVALALLATGQIVCAPQAGASDALVLLQRLPTPRSLIAHASSEPTAVTTAADPICDIFANGYDVTGAGPCASCFDNTINFGETDVDCGGAYCKGCSSGLVCSIDADCQSGICANNVCADPANHLLISQVQTRGDGAASDEFVELYNATSFPVAFDSNWTLTARSTSSVSYTPRIVGAGQVIPAHSHILFAGSAYNAAITADALLSSAITDASSLVLLHSGNVIDALCFYFDASTQAVYANDGTYVCEGTPVSNLPHNNTTSGSSNTDASLERKPGGALGNAQDTGDNATDFSNNAAPDPHNLASPPTP
jgi:hypothetical protein